MKLRFTPNALNDLRGIRDYIRERNPAAAVRVRVEIDATLQLLCAFPQMGRLRRPGVRAMPLPRRPYLVFYWPDEDAGELVIFSIQHAAQRPII